jgi:hypothetical protein
VRSSLSLLSCAALLLGFAAISHAEPPARVEIEYELTRNGIVMAEVVDRLEHADGSYRLSETWKGRGLFTLLGRAERTSHGTVAADGLRPLEFEDARTGRSTAHAWFDWRANTFTMRYKGRSTTEALPANAQDGLTFLLTFSFAPPQGEPVRMHVINGRGMSEYLYQVAGRERLRVPAGEFDALKLLRKRPGESGIRGEIWLAVDRSHLPVRILVVEDDGTRYEQVATRISPP